jgi:hypothetical protein
MQIHYNKLFICKCEGLWMGSQTIRDPDDSGLGTKMFYSVDVAIYYYLNKMDHRGCLSRNIK